MKKIEAKNFAKPDEVKKFAFGQIEQVNFEGSSVGKSVFQPGWRWSTSVKPIAKTDSCQVHHEIYMLAGRMMVQMNDGTQKEVAAGDAVILPPGHNVWVVGNEPAVFVDFGDVAKFAKAK